MSPYLRKTTNADSRSPASSTSASHLSQDKSLAVVPVTGAKGVQDHPPKTGYGKALKKRQVSSEESGDENWLISYADMMTLLFGFFVLLMSFSKFDVEKFEKARQETTQYFGGEYKVPFEKFTKDLKKQIQDQKLDQQVRIKVDETGVVITFRGALFFELGSSEMRKEAVSLLDKIVPIIKKQGASFNIQIEGHTDDNPIADARFPSNWELSAFRATNVLHYFERVGFPKQGLKAIGFGEIEPLVPNRDGKGQVIKENQAQNRRVVIRLVRNSLTD